MSLSDVRAIVRSLITALSVVQAALLAIEKLLGGPLEISVLRRPAAAPTSRGSTEQPLP